jgi:hypothetical protein
MYQVPRYSSRAHGPESRGRRSDSLRGRADVLGAVDVSPCPNRPVRGLPRLKPGDVSAGGAAEDNITSDRKYSLRVLLVGPCLWLPRLLRSVRSTRRSTQRTAAMASRCRALIIADAQGLPMGVSFRPNNLLQSLPWPVCAVGSLQVGSGQSRILFLRPSFLFHDRVQHSQGARKHPEPTINAVLRFGRLSSEIRASCDGRNKTPGKRETSILTLCATVLYRVAKVHSAGPSARMMMILGVWYALGRLVNATFGAMAA